MPKSQKKKREKSSDFTKSKLKVGKGKQAAKNATDTSFKSRVIHLPVQNVQVSSAEDEALTKKRHTFHQVLSRLRHYSAAIRRVSVHELQEVLSQTGIDDQGILSQAFEVCARLIGDEDPDVRKTLLEFVRWISCTLPSSKLQPHVSLWLLHALSNMAHIFPDIRVDAIRMLRILLDAVPAAVINDLETSGSISRVFDAFRSILQVKRRYAKEAAIGGSVSIMLRARTKCEVLGCLQSFVESLFNTRIAKSPPSIWFLRSPFDSKEAFEAFETCLDVPLLGTAQWSDGGELDGPDGFLPCSYSTGEFRSGAWEKVAKAYLNRRQPMAATEIRSADDVIEFMRDFTPALVDTILESSSIVSSYETEDVDENAVHSMQLCLAVLNLVFGATLHTDGPPTYPGARGTTYLEDALTKLSEIFPHTAKTGAGSTQAAYLSSSNQLFCRLVALHHLTQRDPSSSTTLHLKPASSYVREWLAQQTPCTTEEYNAMMPVLWCLLHVEDRQAMPPSTPPLFTLLVNHCVHVTFMSPVKQVAVDFIARLILLQGNRRRITTLQLQADAASRFLLSLPRLLWELGSRNQHLTQNICLFFLRSLLERNILVASVLTTLAHHLVPFFFMENAARSGKLGPCSELPVHLQRLFCDMTALLPEHSALRTAVSQFQRSSIL